MSTTLESESVLTDAVLQAASTAVANLPGNPYAHGRDWQGCGVKNPPLLTVLDGLISAAAVTANAIADNCWDDCLPLKAADAKGLAEALHRIGDTITAAASAPDAAGWSLPSCTGKELV
jgi:hypothetical protein